jgi:hypothetical protein
MKKQNSNSSSFVFASLKPYTPPQEYAESRWFGRDEILLGQFHPILKQAIEPWVWMLLVYCRYIRARLSTSFESFGYC